ncbi:MAG: hypothetical protein JST39_20410 [Bacteroidetes bacterium]|nr:hypothetical protein [Bacteroidota bacterium]
MRKQLLIFSMSICVLHHAGAQTIITEMDKVTYYNSLDTSISSVFNQLAWLCNCYMLRNYPKLSIPVKLDMELSRDSVSYEVGFDNLYGNSGFPDTTGQGENPADRIYFDTGLRIRACDTVINKEYLLKLLDYGLQHYEELKTMRQEVLMMLPSARPRHCSIDSGSLQALLLRRSSSRIKDAIRYCQ